RLSYFLHHRPAGLAGRGMIAKKMEFPLYFSIHKGYNGRKKQEGTSVEILQKTIEQIRKQYGLAGGILVAVKDGKVVLKECFGQADAEQNKPVDSKTLFQIASCSKAFTTMVAGQLCDEGKMTWDTPVKQLMPDFQM